MQDAFCDGVCMEHFALSVIRISTVIAKKQIYSFFFVFSKDILTTPLNTFVFVMFFALRMEGDNYDNIPTYQLVFCVRQDNRGEMGKYNAHSKRNKLNGIVCKGID